MAIEYKWDSQQRMNDIINAINDETDREKHIDPWTFRYKDLKNGACKFNLEYNQYWPRSLTYRQSYLKGTITETEKGCHISAMVCFKLENILIYINIFTFFLMSVIVTCECFRYNHYAGILFLLIPASCLAWNLYTYKLSKKEQPHLDIVTSAAKVEPYEHFFY